MFGELTQCLAPDYSDRAQMAINAGRDAATAFRSLCRADRANAVKRAELIINHQCPAAYMTVAVEAFNKEVESSVLAQVKTTVLASDRRQMTVMDPLVKEAVSHLPWPQRFIFVHDQDSSARACSQAQDITLRLVKPFSTRTFAPAPPRTQVWSNWGEDEAFIASPGSDADNLRFLEKTLKLMHA